MAELVYLACALVSVFCAVLLIRSYRRTRLRLVLLTCLCFCGLAVNNVLLFCDLVLVQNIDLGLWRNLTALGALAFLVVGLILEGR
jgi:hypothetical protein